MLRDSLGLLGGLDPQGSKSALLAEVVDPDINCDPVSLISFGGQGYTLPTQQAVLPWPGQMASKLPWLPQ